jgi:hypothetical protein
MIDHAQALEVVLVRPAFRATTAEDHEADGHVARCSTCGPRVEAVRRDAGAIARHDAGEPAPWVRSRVREQASRRDGSLGALRLLAVAILLGALVVGGVAGAGALLQGMPDEPTAAVPQDLSAAIAGKRVQWKTDVVLLAADDVAVTANGKTYRPLQPKVGVHSDPGSLDYWTLEVTWSEGLEQRINLYFAADASSWWVSEVRAYDGVAPSPDWAGFPKQTYFRTPHGRAYTGDIELDGLGRAGPVHLSIPGAILAVSPQQSFVAPPGGGVALKDDPFRPGGELHCSGILQLAPQQAETRLRALGLRLSWRLSWKTGPNTGYAERANAAPATGFISNAAIGSNGELIVFVEDPTRPSMAAATFPPDCPAPSAP